MSADAQRALDDAVNVAELQQVAEERLAPMAWDYYAGGAGDEVTLRANRAAFERRALHYRVLAGVATRDARTTVLGQPVSFPVLIAPTASSPYLLDALAICGLLTSSLKPKPVGRKDGARVWSASLDVRELR